MADTEAALGVESWLKIQIPILFSSIWFIYIHSKAI